MKQKIVKILLCFNLLLPGLYTSSVPGFSAVEVSAEDTPTGTVRGGVAILITFLLANGMRFVGHFDEIEQGISDLWDDFSAATGNTVGLMNLTAGAVLHLGYLRFNSSVQNAMTAFQNWLVAQKNIPSTGITDISVGAGASTFYPIQAGCNLNLLHLGTRAINVNLASGSDVRMVYLCKSDYSSGYVHLVSLSNFDAGIYLVAWPSSACSTTSSTVRNTMIDGIRYYYVSYNTGSYAYNATDSLVPAIVVSSPSSTNDAVSNTFGDNSIADTSIENETLDLIDGWNLANDQARLLDIAVLQTLVNRIGLTLDNIDDLIDDIPALYDIPWSTDFPDDPTLVDTPDDTIPWVDMPDSTVPADPSSDIPDTPAEEGEYKILGLERVFPFSIPFDLIALVRVLRASPETPEFDVPMYDPVEQEVITEHVDLHQFDSWAAIMRSGSTLFFLAGLILITRNLIRG